MKKVAESGRGAAAPPTAISSFSSITSYSHCHTGWYTSNKVTWVMKKAEESGRGAAAPPTAVSSFSSSILSSCSSTASSGLSGQACVLGVCMVGGVGGIGGRGILLEVSRSRPERVRSSSSQDLEGWGSRVGLDLGASRASCWMRSSMVERGTLGTTSDTCCRNEK